jgi:lipoprotein-anchoring transpeptidase ErfK/SrfK
MRRLVVISGGKSKVMLASVGAALCLTSIHVAATARTATLKREQEQLEQGAASSRPVVVDTTQAFKALQPGNQLAVHEQPSSDSSGVKAAPATGAANPTAHKRQVVISIADRQLAVLDNGQLIKIYPIAVGARGTPSPDGDFVIINRARDPIYRHGDKEIAPGKDNPLGSRWLGLNLKGYGIHGTNVQSSVGKPASHGCFRMRKQDVEELYTLVQVGDTVTVRREHDAMITQVFSGPVAAAGGTILAAKEEQSQDELAPVIATATVGADRY